MRSGANHPKCDACSPGRRPGSGAGGRTPRRRAARNGDERRSSRNRHPRGPMTSNAVADISGEVALSLRLRARRPPVSLNRLGRASVPLGGRRRFRSGRAAAGWTSPRSGCHRDRPAHRLVWPPWPSAPSPPPCSAAARYPGTRPGPAGPAPARRPGAVPAHRPRDRRAARPPPPPGAPALAGLAPPPPALSAGTTSAPGSPETNTFSWQLATGPYGSGHQFVTCGDRPQAMAV